MCSYNDGNFIVVGYYLHCATDNIHSYSFTGLVDTSADQQDLYKLPVERFVVAPTRILRSNNIPFTLVY